MAVDPSKILLPPEKPTSVFMKNRGPVRLVADDLNVADYLTRNERHAGESSANLIRVLMTRGGRMSIRNGY